MPLLILDRDGVINHDSENYIRSLADWRPIDGSFAAIAEASKAGYTVVVATNQSGLARGYFNEATLEQIHASLVDGVRAAGGRVNAIYYCPHGPDEGCSCRKPAPGMVLQALSDGSFSAADAVMVGDSLRDLQAAEQAGVQPILVLTGNGAKTAQSDKLPQRTEIFPNLAAAVSALLAAQNTRSEQANVSAD